MLIEFTEKDLDYVANTLAQRPWAEVHALLENLRQQIQRQQMKMPVYTGNGAQEPDAASVDPH